MARQNPSSKRPTLSRPATSSKSKRAAAEAVTPRATRTVDTARSASPSPSVSALAPVLATRAAYEKVAKSERFKDIVDAADLRKAIDLALKTPTTPETVLAGAIALALHDLDVGDDDDGDLDDEDLDDDDDDDDDDL